jgi:PPOX class probable F420-dependent enzyme
VDNLTNSPTFDDASPAFFQTIMDNLLTAAKAGGEHARRLRRTRRRRLTGPDRRGGCTAQQMRATCRRLRRDGQPVATATWCLWDGGRVLVNMDEGRKRLEHMRSNPRVALEVLDESDWHTRLSITGHVEEMREDADLVDIDRLARQYTG